MPEKFRDSRGPKSKYAIVPKMTKNSHVGLVILVGVLLLSAVLRLYQLGAESLWTDELESWKQGSYPTLGEVITLGLPDIHPPGYRGLLFLVENTLGDSELALRWASAIGGVLAVAAIFGLGRKLYTPPVGLVAAALLACAWPAIHYSREGRAYSLLLACAILTTWLWLRLLNAWRAKKTSPRLAALVAYALCAAGMAYLHYFGLYLLLWQALGAGLFWLTRPGWNSARVGLLLYCGIALSYAPWMGILWQHLTQGPIWIPPPGDFSTTLLSYLDWAWDRAEGLRWGALALLGLGVAVSFSASLWQAWRAKQFRPLWRWAVSPSLFLLAWFALPFGLVYLKSVYSASVLTPRNLIILLPPLYLLLARAMTHLATLVPAQFPKLRWSVVALLTTLGMGASLYQIAGPMQYYTTPQKGLFREAVRYIGSNESQYPNALIIGYSWDPAYIDYYFRRLGYARRVEVSAGNRPEIPAVTAALATRQPKYVWYIRAFRNPESEFLDFLRQHLTQLDYREFPGPDSWLNTEVWVFEVKQ
jgi:hypothetical protein